MKKKELDLLDAGTQIREVDPIEADEVGFTASCLVNACLPYRNPKPEQLQNGVWERKNGGYSLWVQGGPKGLPYGSYPRLFTIWATTEAIRSKSRDLNAGNSFRSFCRALGVNQSGGERGSRTRLAEQIDRLLSSRLAFRRDMSTIEGGVTTRGHRKTEFLEIAEGYEEFWQPQNPDQMELYDWHIILSQKFYDEITEHYVLLDMRAVHELKSRPLALDLYQWLAYRNFNMKGNKACPTWSQLAFQFGSQYGRLRDFRAEMQEALLLVKSVYKGLKAECTEQGMTLYKSPTPVPSTGRVYLTQV